MPSDPLDSIRVRLELDVSKVKSDLDRIEKTIKSRLGKTYRLHLAINKNDLRSIRSQINQALSKPFSIRVQASNVRSTRAAATGRASSPKTTSIAAQNAAAVSRNLGILVLDKKHQAVVSATAQKIRTAYERIRQSALSANNAIWRSTESLTKKESEIKHRLARTLADLKKREASREEELAHKAVAAAETASARSVAAQERLKAVTKDTQVFIQASNEATAAKLERIRAKEELDLSKATTESAKAAIQIESAWEQSNVRKAHFEKQFAVLAKQSAAQVEAANLKSASSIAGAYGRTAKQDLRNFNATVLSARTNVELLASSIFTVRNVVAALSTLGVFRVFRSLSSASKEFETGLTGVAKTADLTEEQVAALAGQMTALSFEVPIATQELLEIGVAAGQLGIKGTQNITKFARALGLLQLSSDVQGEEGARQVARILSITKEPIENVDRFASALVELGNNAAATEKEILEVATRVAQATATFNVSSTEVLGLSTTLREFGVEAELAGTQIGLTFQALSQAAFNNTGKAAKFLEKLGIDVKEFSKTFRETPTDAFNQFIDAIGKLDRLQAAAALQDLGLDGARMLLVLGPLTQNFARLQLRINQSKDAFKDNTAAVKEAERFGKTFEGQMQIVSNRLRAVRIEIGDQLNPAIVTLARSFAEFLTADTDKTVSGIQNVTAAFAALAALKIPVILGDIGIGLARIKLLREIQRKDLLGIASKATFTQRALILLGQGFSKFGLVSTAALTATAFAASKLAGTMARASADMTLGKNSRALTSWEALGTIIKSLGKYIIDNYPQATEALRLFKKEIDLINVPDNVGQALLDKTTKGLNQLEEYVVITGPLNRLGKEINASLKLIENLEKASGRTNIPAIQEQNRKRLEEETARYQELLAKQEALLLRQRELRGGGGLGTAMSEGLAAGTEDKNKGMMALEERLDTINQQFEENIGIVALFGENIAKAETVLNDLRQELDATYNSGDAFVKFLHDEGLSEFALQANDATATTAALSIAYGKAKDAISQLQSEIDKTTDPSIKKSLEDQKKEYQETVEEFERWDSVAASLTDTMSGLRKAFSNKAGFEFRKTVRDQLEEIEMRTSALADPADFAGVDIEKFIELWSQFGKTGVIAYKSILDAAKELKVAQDGLDFQKNLADLFQNLSEEIDQAAVKSRLLEMGFDGVGNEAVDLAVQAGLTSKILDEMSEESIQELIDKLRKLQEVMNEIKEDESFAEISEELREELSFLDAEIAKITNNSDDWARALGITKEQLSELETKTGELDERTLEYLTTLGLTNDQLQTHADRIAEINDRIEELKRLEKLDQVAQSVGDAFVNLGDSITDGLLNGKASLDDFKEYFRQFVNEIIAQIIRILIIQTIANAITGAVGAALGGGGGSIVSSSNLGLGGKVGNAVPGAPGGIGSTLGSVPGVSVSRGISAPTAALANSNISNYNTKTESPVTIFIDARNSKNPNEVEEMVMKGISKAAPEIERRAVAKVMDDQRRNPQKWR